MRSVILSFLVALFSGSVRADGIAHDFEFTSIDGDPMPFTQYAGKAMLVVNTASRCGLTGQYDGLQALWEKYRDRGLVVIGVPSNDFLGQEPGSEETIKEFCEVNFNIDFPMTEKNHVRGKKAHPFYVWAKQTAGGPRWNFHKYLIDPDGNLVKAFAPGTKPDAQKLTESIEAHLPVIR